MAVAASPSFRATAPGFSDAVASCATISAVESFAFGPASHCGAAAARPLPAQVCTATIATASSGGRPGLRRAPPCQLHRPTPAFHRRRGRHDGKLHSRPPAVDAELRTAVDLARGIGRRCGVPINLVGRRLGDIFGHWQLCGRVHNCHSRACGRWGRAPRRFGVTAGPSTFQRWAAAVTSMTRHRASATRRNRTREWQSNRRSSGCQ